MPPLLTVVLPTRNNEDVIASHIEKIEEWLGRADEIIVIDSSEDGTLELCRGLLPPGTLFIKKPPGLYEAWNDAVARAGSKYIYFSTVGDVISGEGIGSLLDFCEDQELDMVISPPTFTGDRNDAKWPIHHIIESFNIKGRLVMGGADIGMLNYYCLGLYGLSSLSGSFASNLVRTSVLKENPFPIGYGGFSDTVWFAENCIKMRIGICSSRHATFWIHKSEHDMLEAERLHRIWENLFNEAGIRYAGFSPEVLSFGEATRSFYQTKVSLEKLRKLERRTMRQYIESGYLSLKKKRGRFLVRLNEIGYRRSIRLMLRNASLYGGRDDDYTGS